MQDPIDKFLENSIPDEDDYDDAPIHPPIVVERDSLKEPHHENVIENAKHDYEFVRTNLKQIIETNVKALEGLAKVAQESESPRAYEVLSTYMKQMTDANESLMRLHKDTKEITATPGDSGVGAPDGQVGAGGTVSMSTEDLLDMLEEKEKRASESARTIEGEISNDQSE